MVAYCTLCNNKKFVNEEALRQHVNQSPKHRKPKQPTMAQGSKNGQVAATNTIAVPQPTLSYLVSGTTSMTNAKPTTPQSSTGLPRCKMCNMDFSTVDELNSHYKSGYSSRHPKCVRCGDGFEDHGSLNFHMSKAHPLKFCEPCQKFIYISDIDKHIAESPIHSAYECVQCEVRFISEALRKTHYLKSGAVWHAVCYECSEGFVDVDALLDHSKIVHPNVFCKTCNLYVLEQDLGKHWTESAKHPTCISCEVSFESDDTFKQHLFEVHPELCCRPCEFASRTLSGLQTHYDTSSLHPKCPVCSVGFSTIVSLDKHVCSVPRQAQPPVIAVERLSSSSSAATLQPTHKQTSIEQLVCEICDRQFKHDLAIAQHYRDHSAHPKCRPCNIGFKDSAAYDLHVLSVHPVPSSRTPATQSTAQSEPAADFIGVRPGLTGDRSEEQPVVVDKLSEVPVACMPEASSIPVVVQQQEVEAHDTSDEAESADMPSAPSTPRSESDVPEMTRLVIETPPPRARASSEPPLSSVFGPSVQNTEDKKEIVIDVRQTSEPPIHAEEPDVDLRAPAEHDLRTTSPPPLSTTVESVSSVTPSAGGTPQAVLPQLKPITTLPVPVRPPSIFSPPGRSPYDSPRRFPFRWGGESPVSESTSAPVTPSPTRSLLFSRTFTSVPPAQTETGAEQHRNVGSINDEVPRRCSRAPSVATATSTSSSSASSSSRRHRPKTAQAEVTVTPTTATSTSHTHVEHENAPSRTPPETVLEQKSAALAVTTPPRPALSWDCRVCAHPPTAPTTTLCGHLFCLSCIMLELQKHGQCPVCRRAVLVRLHVEA